MRIKDILIGGIYRHKDNPNIGYAKVLNILKPRTINNQYPHYVVECEWSYDDNFKVFFIKYFSPNNLIKIK